jgi:hypothetical protein
MNGAGERYWSILLGLASGDAEQPATSLPTFVSPSQQPEHGCEWISTDHDFACFPGLKSSPLE